MFFNPPPIEIGEVKSAYSNLTPTSKSISPRERTYLIRILTIIGAVAGLAINYYFALSGWWIFVSPGVGAWICSAIALFNDEGFEYDTTYIGSEGMAHYISDNYENPREKLLVRYDKIKYLLRDCTKYYTNGVYEHTSWSVVWAYQDSAGAEQLIYYCGGFSEEGDPGPEYQDYWFVSSAAQLWTEHLLSRWSQTIRAGDLVNVELRDGTQIFSIAHSGLVLPTGTGPVVVSFNDIEGLNLSEGILRISLSSRAQQLSPNIHMNGQMLLPRESIRNFDAVFVLLRNCIESQRTSPD